jgi:membrane-bound lytic murein transglycosylase A
LKNQAVKAVVLKEAENTNRIRLAMKLKIISHYPVTIAFAMIIVFLVFGCVPTKKKPTRENAMERISFWSYPDFSDDLIYDGLEHSILKSLSYLQKIPVDRQFVFGEDRYTTDHVIKSLQQFLNYIETKPSSKALKKFIASNYHIYRSVGRNGKGEVLYTGYYEPHLSGSLAKSEIYQIPIYTRPQDLITIDLSLFSEKYQGEKIIGRYTGQTVVPYYERSEIASKDVLAGNSEVLAWVQDPVEVFFLQIQGSGKVYLDNGEVINVHYHTTNGRPYRSIGKLLIDQKKISVEEMSMQKIREYLHNHPDEIDSVFNYNPSYVFFKIEPDGPLGNINVKLTPGRSIALDRRLFPPAALVFIKTEKPVVDGTGQIHRWRQFSRFAVHQDTGGAIRGPGRADIFWGNGPYAEIAAGHLKHTGELFFLILKPDA